MVELLTYGGIKFLLNKIIGKLCNKYCSDVLYKKDPELVYFTNEKKDSIAFKITKNVLLYLLFCVPGLSDVIFAGYTAYQLTVCAVARGNTDELTSYIKSKYTNPINKKNKMDIDRKDFDSKSITESLILDGADQKIINEVLSDVKKEIGYDFEDEKLYSNVSNNASNMHKLKKYAKVVSNPVKLYKDTKDNEITDIFISDEDLEKLVVHMNLMYSCGEFERSKSYKLKK